MGKWKKFFYSPGLYWRDYWLKRYPLNEKILSPVRAQAGAPFSEHKKPIPASQRDDSLPIPFSAPTSDDERVLVCICQICRLQFILPVLNELPISRIAVYIPDDSGNMVPYLQGLVEGGVRIIREYSDLSKYKYFMVDSWFSFPSWGEKIRDYVSHRIEVISYTHSTDPLCKMEFLTCDDIVSGIHYISSNESFLRSAIQCWNKSYSLSGKYFYSYDHNVEVTYTGLFHLDSSLPEEDVDHPTMELMFGDRYDRRKKTVYYYEDEFSDLYAVYEGLNRLAEQFNVIVKPWSRIKTRDGDRFMILNWESNREPLGKKFRMFADVVLTGPRAGTTSTCLMLGQRVIPTYTLKCSGSSFGDLNLNYLQGLGLGHGVHGKINTKLSPLHILDTDTISSRINDCEYWENYETHLHELQMYIFGDYKVDGAAKETADCILRILDTGSFTSRSHSDYGSPE